MRIVVAGCGRMGLGMARALRAAGFDAKGFDVRPASEFGAFAPHMLPGAEAARAHAEVLITVVRDIRQTEDLLFDSQALLRGSGRLRTLVISSTLSPKYVTALAGRVPAGLELIDAPMSGAQIAADERRLSFMLGGDDAALDRLMPAFRAMGTAHHRMGGFGAGMAAKVLNNFVAVATVAANRQAYDWAEALGLDRARLRALMHDSSGQTWFGSNFDSIEFARDGYDPENTVGILLKDVASALDGVDAPDDPLGRAVMDRIAALRPYED